MSASSAPALTDLPPGERILRTAHDLFYRDGIRATGIDRIISESKVAKVTFYRQYASKDELVRAFLDYRHARWMGWFKDSLARHAAGRKRPVDALVPALREWFEDPGFRGCAFLNAVGEFGSEPPHVAQAVRGHKADMVAEIRKLLPRSRKAEADAKTLGVAVDGAIVHAQFSASPKEALRALSRLVDAIVPAA